MWRTCRGWLVGSVTTRTFPHLSTRPQVVAVVDTPLTQSTRIRQNIVSRPTGQALERTCPAAVEIVTDQHVALHGHLNGHAVDYAGNRGESYFRDQVSAVRVLTNEDEARLVVQAPAPMVSYYLPPMKELAQRAPEDFALALAALAPTVGCALTPFGMAANDIQVEATGMAEFTLALLVLVREVLKDRILEDHERAELLRHVQEGKARLAAIEATVLTAERNQERRTAPRAGR
jgi:hypothetical protein